MQTLYCPHCGRMFRADRLYAQIIDGRAAYYCPSVECSFYFNELVEIDEMMVYPIEILNQKGYKTRFCCSGHMFSPANRMYNEGYILFDNIYKFPSIPRYWKYEVFNDVESINKQLSKLTSTIKNPFTYMNSLVNWVDKL